MGRGGYGRGSSNSSGWGRGGSGRGSYGGNRSDPSRWGDKRQQENFLDDDEDLSFGSARFGAKNNKDADYIPAVHQDRQFVRHVLRPYPGKNGEVFFKKDGARSDKDILDPKRLNKKMSHLTEEFMNRPGTALSITGGSIAQLAAIVDKYVDEGSGKLAPTGLVSFAKFLKTPDGESFWSAADYLNTARTTARNRKETKQAITTLFEVAADADRFDVNAMQRLANASAKMLTGAIKVIELVAVIRGDRQHWANELKIQANLMPSDMKAFLKDPLDDEALVEALAACFDAVAEDAPGSAGGFLDDDGHDDSSAPAFDHGRASFGRRASGRGRDDDEKKDERSGRERKTLFGKAAKQEKQPRAASPSRAEDPPAKKAKLFGSSAASGKKDNGETFEVEGSGNETPPAKFDVEDWPLSEIVAWKKEAEMEASRNDFAKLEAQKQLRLLEAVPAMLRKEHGLPEHVGDLKTLEKNAEDNGRKLLEMVRDVQLAWIGRAENFTNEKHGWDAPQDDLNDGFLILKCGDDVQFFENDAEQTEVKAMIDELEAAEEDDKKDIIGKLIKKEHEMLRRVCDEKQAAVAFTACADFACAHKNKEPSAKAIKDVMEMLPESLRNVCEVSEVDKYRKIKAKHWKKDVSKILSLAFRAYDVWLL